MSALKPIKKKGNNVTHFTMAVGYSGEKTQRWQQRMPSTSQEEDVEQAGETPSYVDIPRKTREVDLNSIP